MVETTSPASDRLQPDLVLIMRPVRAALACALAAGVPMLAACSSASPSVMAVALAAPVAVPVPAPVSVPVTAASSYAAPAPAATAQTVFFGWATTVTRLERGPRMASLHSPRLETSALPPGSPGSPPSITGPAHTLTGLASYYWQPQQTSSGETFDKRSMTAAHKTLPFNTRVRVTDLVTGRSVIVRINDRGPFKPGRVIDLSEAAAEHLGMVRSGITPVKIEVVKN